MKPQKSLSDKVLSELEELIVNSNPGDRLPSEKELSEMLGTGRSTIRECMMVFVAKKVVIRRNEGSFVAESMHDSLVDPLDFILKMKLGTIHDLIELREILELIIIRLAAERATEQDILEMERKNWLLKEPGLSTTEMQNRDAEFHRAIAQSTGNKIMAELDSALRTILIERIEAQNENTIKLTEMNNTCLHEELISHIRSHDSEQAYDALRKYFKEIYKVMTLHQA